MGIEMPDIEKIHEEIDKNNAEIDKYNAEMEKKERERIKEEYERLSKQEKPTEELIKEKKEEPKEKKKEGEKEKIKEEDIIQKLTPENVKVACKKGKPIELKVKITSGEIEDGWVVKSINPETGIAIVLKFTEKKGKASSFIRKDISIEELKEWNKQETKEPREKKEKTGKKKDEQPEKKEEKLKEQKEKSPEKQLDKIIKEIGEGNISLDKLTNFLSIPGAGEAISKILNNSKFQEKINKPETRKKIKEYTDKLQEFIDKEKEGPKSKVITKAKKFIKEQIKTEGEQKKESPRKTTFGAIGGIIVFFLAFLLLLGLTGVNYLADEAGGKKRK